MKRIIRIEGIPFPGAKVYSIFARRFFRDFYKEVTEEVVLRISSGRILDVGAGPGYLPLEMAKRSQNLEIIGIDVSSAMVKIASRNAENMGLSERVKFKVGNAQASLLRMGILISLLALPVCITG